MQINNSDIVNGIDNNSDRTPKLDTVGASFPITLASDAANWNFIPNTPVTPSGQLAAIVFNPIPGVDPWSYIHGSLSGRQVTLSLRSDAPAGRQLSDVSFTIYFAATTGNKADVDPVIPTVGVPR